MTESKQADVFIVGAGIAGLMAARELARRGAQVLVVEQDEAVGGRLATRHLGPGRADSGAQFFTAREAEFQAWVDRWLDAGLVYEWSRGWSDGSLGTTPATGHPRYAVRGGMQALATHLAAGLPVQTGTRIVSIVPDGAGWLARDAGGSAYHAPALILTPPVPVALGLLDPDAAALAPSDHAILTHIDYTPCLSGLFWMNGDMRLPEPGAVQRPNATITWIADNRRKGISPDATLVTIHAGPDYSRQYWDRSDTEALNALASALQLFKDYRTEIVQSRLDRWRYATPIGIYRERCLKASDLPPLIFAGDAFGGPRVEGAALSGLAAAEHAASRA
ncbi:NAD(P)/FAD-dependent oxidoreductase [Aggregatilinea lenta]|uniref:NAD(P)/FAD-dependent oxidoreductase n=1 Tax=Aggregatilinea lenta TaxID=913108 RepID=UPI0013C30E25|nr:FAD-dependent oxidoreductase [Aggregatilinea lenta]